MKEQSTETVTESRPVWEGLEAFARQGVQDLLQRVLEEEVAALLGRQRYARREGVDVAAGYRNGYGKPRRLSLSVGTITLRRPRVRGLAERFESQLLPLFKRRTEAVGQRLPRLYLHGLALGDFDLALRGLLGEGAPLSAASVARLKAGWQAEYELWRPRSLADLEPVFLWVDGVYVKAGLEKDKAAMLVVLAGLRDGRKVILAVESGHRESTESWRAVLRDLQRRGLRAPRVVVGDGHLGIWGALPAVFPTAAEQRCWNHRLLNLLDKLPRRLQAEAKSLLTKIPLCRDPRGGGAAEAGLPDVGDEARRGGRRPSAGSGLGALGDVLPVPEGALEAPADDEPDRVAVRRRPAADDRGQAIQARRERDGGHLEDPADRRADLPAPRCARAARGGCGRRDVRQRGAREAEPGHG